MLAWPDIVIIIGYFVIVLSLGAYFSRYMKSQKDFFLAGKKMPWWIAACSLQATDIGPETYIGVTGIVAASGLAWLNYDWLPACTIPCIISAWFFPFLVQRTLHGSVINEENISPDMDKAIRETLVVCFPSDHTHIAGLACNNR